MSGRVVRDCQEVSVRSLSRIALAVILGTASIVAADDPREIVRESQRRTDAKSQRYEGSLQVIDSKGKIADKRWTFTRLGSHGDSKAVLRFTQPAEVKGVALLIANHPDRASDQWMWVPALQRERRIALQDRSTRFFGTDFSFEDLEERDVNQFDYRLLNEEAVDGAACWHIESTPASRKSSQYSRSEIWIRKDNYAFAQIENFIKTDLVRRLKYSDLVQVQGIWTARHLEMTDLRRNSRTVLSIEKLEYNVPLREEDFTIQALRNPL
jgi:Outer membrane lipoprotein-sorting protein